MRKILSSLLLFSLISSASADEINLTTELSKVLFVGKSSVPFPGVENTFCTPNGQINGNPFVAAFYDCVYYFRNVRATSIEVTYSDVKKGAIPDSIVSQPFTYKNCTNSPLPVSDTISVTTTEGQSISTSTALTEGSNSTMTTSISVPVKAVTFGMTDSKTVNFSKTVTDATQNTYTKSSTVTQSLNFTIPPMTAREVRLEKVLTTGYIDFDGTVSFEADVGLRIKDKQNGQIVAQEVSMGTLTALTPNPADRVLHLKGQIWNVKGEAVSRKDKDYSLADNPTACGNDKKTVLKSSGTEKNMKLLGTIPLLKANPNSVDSGILTETGLINGMYIQTANVVANVNVRAKSQGPGFCAVTINSNSSAINFLAPPFSWSPWTTLFSHIGSAGSTITTSIGCDTGALFEIQYYK